MGALKFLAVAAGTLGLAGLAWAIRWSDRKDAANKGGDYVDTNGVVWTFYERKDGMWEATVLDPDVDPAYVDAFSGKTREAVIGMIDGHAMTHKPKKVA